MEKFVIKFTDKESGKVSYYRKADIKYKMLYGIRCQFYDYELTDDINKARVYYSECETVSMINDNICLNQPVWASKFYITTHRLPTKREQISLDMTPLKKIVAYANGYKKASAKGRAELRKKMFDEKFIMACKESLDKINKLK